MTALRATTLDRQGHGVIDPAVLPPALRRLDETARGALIPALRPLSLARQETVISEGRSPAGPIFVACGAVRLFTVLMDGRRQITGFRFPGEMLVTAWSETPFDVSAQTMTASVLLRIAEPALAALRRDHPRLDRKLQDMAARELAQTRDHLVSLGRRNPIERLARFLLTLLEGANGLAPDAGETTEIVLPMTRQDIADYLGVETETVSRLITRLKRLGIVALPQQRRIQLCDRASLVALAEGQAVTKREIAAAPRAISPEGRAQSDSGNRSWLGDGSCAPRN